MSARTSLQLGFDLARLSDFAHVGALSAPASQGAGSGIARMTLGSASATAQCGDS